MNTPWFLDAGWFLGLFAALATFVALPAMYANARIENKHVPVFWMVAVGVMGFTAWLWLPFIFYACECGKNWTRATLVGVEAKL